MQHRVNSLGHLVLGGCDAVALARQFGTPLYVFDEMVIRETARAMMAALPPDKGSVHFSCKALCTQAILKLLAEEGLGFDITSGGELYTVLEAGIDPKTVTFHGNNKTFAELDDAVAAGVGLINIDNPADPETLAQLAAKHGKTQRVTVRMNLGIDAHTHEYLRTSVTDCKFGFSFADGAAMRMIREVLACKMLELAAVNCHIGSQILEPAPFEQAAGEMVAVMEAVFRETGYLLPELVLGGGFGIRYIDEAPTAPQEMILLMRRTVEQRCAERGLPVPRLSVEPGRSLVGPAGTTLYTIGGRREQGVETDEDGRRVPRVYVSVDGGMGDNPRVMLYQAEYDAVLAGRANDAPQEAVSVAGRFCETGDLLIKRIRLPKPNPGEILAVFTTGAYNHAMASNYNRVPIPAAVLARGGKAELIVKRQTYEQIAANDCLPSWME